MIEKYVFIGVMLFNQLLWAQVWDQGVPVPPDGRKNILGIGKEEMEFFYRAGQIHAQHYPVTVTGMLPPLSAGIKFNNDDQSNPLKIILSKIVRGISGIKSFDQVLQILGLREYPLETDTGVYQVAYPEGKRPDYRMGFGLIERNGAQGFTFSCAACHSSQLFGKTVLGMTNRFPTANEFFVKAKKLEPAIDLWVFKKATGATEAEVDLMAEVKENIKRVSVKSPINLGLDTSLAQVALSLNHRSRDEYATPSSWYEKFPRRDEFLDNYPADSKPAVWWNVKYKNRWLSDGSVLSGNPIFTNIIWNEIGRGVDLKMLEFWLSKNQKTVDEITAAVFATEAPKFTDFFPAEFIDIEKAKKGEKLFNQSCARCHGHYEKAWNLPHASQLTHLQKIQTTQVIPKAQTFVVDVGTDSYRRRGMKSLEQLNDLSISKKNKIVIKAQDGYVPPPLVGIWARWPYFHNNSVPSLCAVLSPSQERPTKYYAGEAIDKETDFDRDCNGYPPISKVPDSWKQDKYLYDTSRRGMSNSGHDVGIFIQDGKEIFNDDDKKAIIQYLQTL